MALIRAFSHGGSQSIFGYDQRSKYLEAEISKSHWPHFKDAGWEKVEETGYRNLYLKIRKPRFWVLDVRRYVGGPNRSEGPLIYRLGYLSNYLGLLFLTFVFAGLFIQLMGARRENEKS